MPEPDEGQRREVRLLLATIGVSVVMLLLLARFRFPEETARGTVEPPAAAPLERLAARATFDELASTMADLERRIASRLEIVRVQPERPTGSFVPAPRLTPDRGVVVLGPGEQVSGGSGAGIPLVIGRDGVRDLAVVALSPRPDDVVSVRPGPPRAGPRYVAVAEATSQGPVIRPVYTGRMELIQDPRVSTPLLSVAALQQTLPQGAAIFGLDGQFIGLATRSGGLVRLVPGESLLALARQAHEAPARPGDLGIDVQALTSALARASGAESGVMVSYVDPRGPAAGALSSGDVIRTIDGINVTTAGGFQQLASTRQPGKEVVIAGVRQGKAIDVTVRAVEAGLRQAAAPSNGEPGVALRAVPDAVLRGRPCGPAAGRHHRRHRRTNRAGGGRAHARVPPRGERRGAAPHRTPRNRASGRRAREAMTHILATLRTRAALGLRPVTAPVMVFVPIGVAIGPLGVGLLPAEALPHLDVVVALALATLGVFIGIAAGREGRASRRLFAASTLEACVTIATVTLALTLLCEIWGVPLALPPWLVGLALGISASASAAPHVAGSENGARRIAARVADLDDVLPIVIGGAVVVLASGSAQPLGRQVAITIALGLGIGATGLLLLEHSEGRAERGVFVLGLIALLGGIASYLWLSPLLTGLAAGWLWAAAPGGSDRVVADELLRVQHPLIVLLLLAAGAHLQPTLVGIWLFAPYVLFRIAGKLVGGWAASRLAPAIAPSTLGAYLITPGVIGIAFALNIDQVSPAVSDAIVFSVTSGAIACELLALAVTPAPRPA
jgi:hypothetical protein